jgi:peptide/nickel transport system permease protein
MYAYILRRILATIPVMLIVAFIVFSLLYLTPGDPAAVIAGEHATAEDIARIRANLGLNDPFLLRFGSWIASIMQFDLGTSLLTNMPVSQMIGQRIEPTLSLMLPTLILAVCIAVPFGVIAAWRAGTKVDHFITVFAVLGFSVPVFVVGYALVWSFSLKLGWLPVQGYSPIAQGISRWFQHLVLPCLTLSSAYIALITRITRTAVLEVLQQDYIRTAEAKGVGRRAILFVHALKNASVPIITVIGIGRRPSYRRRRRNGKRVCHSGPRTPDDGIDPAARLPGDPGDRPAVFHFLRSRQPADRHCLHLRRSTHPLLKGAKRCPPSTHPQLASSRKQRVIPPSLPEPSCSASSF